MIDSQQGHIAPAEIKLKGENKTNMPLPHYGVTIGTYKRFEKEPQDNFGNWYHGFIYLDVNGVEYKCAVDVNSPTGQFTYMMLGGLDPTMFNNVSSLSNAYHELSHNASSGAIDYNRSPFVTQPKGCLAVFLGNLECHISHQRKRLENQ